MRRALLPAALALALLASPAAAGVAGAAEPAPADPRDAALPEGWRDSTDVVWTTASDATGFHLLVARERDGWAWRTVASLREDGIETDRWVGNACLTASGRKAVVVYAPRAFTNKSQLFQRGGFTAVVDVATGAVTKLPVRSTLAYFNPGCGDGETAVVSQSRGGEIADRHPAATRLFTVDTRTATVAPPVELPGQVTSPLPVAGGIVAAAGSRLVAVGATGLRTLATATAVPFRLAADGAGGVVYLDHDGHTAYVRHLPTTTKPAAPRELARGPLTETSVAGAARGRVWITGDVTVTGALPPGVRRLDVPAGTPVSAEGGLALVRQETVSTADLDTPDEIQLDGLVLSTGKHLDLSTVPGAATAEPAAAEPLPGPVNQLIDDADQATAPTAATDPVDRDATCAVPRNDAATQVYQPTPRQVEWAADQAVVGNLTTTRPANWKQSGLPSWTPQGMFPSIALSGGGRVNVQILLGILAQESNLWQASRSARPAGC
jgi:hypothetical protein